MAVGSYLKGGFLDPREFASILMSHQLKRLSDPSNSWEEIFSEAVNRP
jgi:hypothetical protein